jgi:hypothetical protein
VPAADLGEIISLACTRERSIHRLSGFFSILKSERDSPFLLSLFVQFFADLTMSIAAFSVTTFVVGNVETWPALIVVMVNALISGF